MVKLLFAVSGILLLFSLVFYLRKTTVGSSGPSDIMQTIREKEQKKAETEFDTQMRKLEADRSAGRISDPHFYKEYARQLELLEYRKDMAANPMKAVCQVSMREEGETKVVDVPSTCDAGLQTPVYRSDAKQKFKIVFTTGQGDPLRLLPRFIAGRGSTVDCDKKNKICLFEGDISYCHDSAERRILRLTPIHE